MAEANTRDRVEPLTGEVLGADHGDDQLPATVVDTSLVGGQTRAEIDIQISTAHRYRRVISAVKRQIETLATLDTETAYACTYRKPQRMQDPETKQWYNGFLQGPSIRFAEIVYQAWGNCRVAARRTNLTEESVEATGVFHDLESNVAIAKSVSRSIMGSEKEGKTAKRFPMHLIETTSNAAASIALRNAILSAVPKGIWSAGYQAAYAAAKGDKDTLGERRDKMLLAWKELGVAQKTVFEILGVRGKDDITLDVLFDAAGFLTAVIDHETTVEQLLAVVRENRPAPTLDEAFGKANANKARAAKKDEPKAPAEQSGQSEGKTGPASADQDFANLSDKARSGAFVDRRGDTVDEKTGEVLKERPTRTGGAQSAEPKPDTPASATDASGASAEETSGQQQQDELSNDGEGKVDDGSPPALDEAAIEEFNDFGQRIKAMTTWPEICGELVIFRRTPAFTRAPEGAQTGTLKMVYDRVMELGAQVSPSNDLVFYEMWLYRAPPTSIEDVWSQLVRSSAYDAAEDDEKGRLADLTQAQQS